MGHHFVYTIVTPEVLEARSQYEVEWKKYLEICKQPGYVVDHNDPPVMVHCSEECNYISNNNPFINCGTYTFEELTIKIRELASRICEDTIYISEAMYAYSRPLTEMNPTDSVEITY